MPSVAELERHYSELHDQRRKLEEMLEKTDRMMLGVKRGLDEMKAGSVTGPGGSNSGATSVPLMRGESQRKESIWSTVPPEPFHRG